MNETFHRLYRDAQGAMHEAMAQASVDLDQCANERADWRAEVIRLRELLWHTCPTGKPECPHCGGTGRVLIVWRQQAGGTHSCPACKGQGWQEIGVAAGEGLWPLAQAGAEEDTWSPR